MKKMVSQKEFNEMKHAVITLAENQSKIMSQVMEVHKELKQTIELLHNTNKTLEIQMDMKRLSTDSAS